METLQRIGPWITLGVAVAVVLFFCGFYIIKLYHVYRDQNTASKKLNDPIIITEHRKKIKKEILSDLEKKLEAL